MRHVVPAILLIVGLIHLLPAGGALGAERLAALYDIAFDDPATLLLMRHRAVLFGLLGAFLVGAAFAPRWRGPALVAGAVSVASFLLLAWRAGPLPAAIDRVVMVDAVAAGLLALGFVLHGREHASPRPAASPSD